jgi:hypothetical protein
MLENSPLPISTETTGADACGLSGLTVKKACRTPEQLTSLLEVASEYFVVSKSRPEPALDLAIAAWLAQSPCHRCAWSKVESTWEHIG